MWIKYKVHDRGVHGLRERVGGVWPSHVLPCLRFDGLKLRQQKALSDIQTQKASVEREIDR